MDCGQRVLDKILTVLFRKDGKMFENRKGASRQVVGNIRRESRAEVTHPE